jgi:hypothetical protein
MSAPDASPFGDRLQERTRPLAPDDAAYGFAHAILCEALSKPFLQVQELFDPEGDLPPVAPLLDPMLCPDWALSWLAQLVGITIPTGTPPDAARSLIVSVSGFRRGTPAAIAAAVQAVLTGSKTVFFRERDGGNPYALEIVTLTAEVPPSDLGLPVNFVPNPSFEIDLTGWGPYGAGTVTLERRADCAYAGNYGVRITKTEGIPNNAGITIGNPHAPPPPTLTLTEPRLHNWSAWVRGRAGMSGAIFMDWIRNGVYESTPWTGENSFTFSGVWERVQVPVTIPPGSMEWSNIYVWAGMNVGDYFDMDAAMLVDGHTLPDYFDGSTPGHVWTGAAHASTSKPVTTHIVQQALVAAKPAGLILAYRTVDSWDYQEMTSVGGTYAQLKLKYATYRDLRDRNPVS